ncbi:MAG: YihY/virulence factor BrkB family protein [Burkholderiaceae bacterium]
MAGSFISELKSTVRPLYRAFQLWSDADGLRMSAAMSFYGVLSLAPLLVLLVAVLGWWVDRSILETNLVGQIRGVVGERGAEVIQQALISAKEPAEGLIASLIAFIVLIVGATGVFAELQDAFERVWRQDTGEAPQLKWWHTATLRLRGVGYILALGFLLLVSLAISAMVGVLASWAGTWLPLKQVLFIVNEMVAFGICMGLFIALMRMSTGPKPRLRHLALGAAFGASLFAAGKHILATYLSTAAVVSSYGAAGSLIILLMWIYFSSAILLLSAGCARAVADEEAAKARRIAGDNANGSAGSVSQEEAAISGAAAVSRGNS